MGLEFAAAAAGFGLIAHLGLKWSDGRKLRSARAKLGAALGIKDGRVESHAIKISSPFLNYLQIEVLPARPLMPQLGLVPRAVGVEAGCRTGDEALDRLFVVRGEPRLVAALMDERARTALKTVGNGRLFISRGCIVVDGFWEGDPEDQLEEFVPLVKTAVVLADLLPIGERIPSRLMHNARYDSHRVVRLENLLLLDSCEFALEDPDPGLRVVAAGLCGRLLQVSESDGIAALEWDRAEVIRPALRALAKIGTLSAVEALRRRERAFFRLGGLSPLLRAAIAEIQSRHGTEGDGNLSVAEQDASGQVSVSGGGGDLSPHG